MRESEAVSTVPARTPSSVLWELASSSRPHFFALPMLAALAGVAIAPGSVRLGIRPMACVIIAGLGWGGAQLLNDVLDRETDAVNAPNRAIAAGRVSVRQAVIVGAAVGLSLAVASAALHPSAWVLSLAGVALVLTYNFAKGLPLLGNLALGALHAVTTALGIASALRSDEGPGAGVAALFEVIRGGWATLLVSASVAAWYLQSNYEKDRIGDSVAGYRTLAVVLGVRWSALLRAVGMVALVAVPIATGLVSGTMPTAMLCAAGIAGGFSTIEPVRRATDDSALGAYRPSVIASILAMGALSVGVLPGATSLIVAVAVLLTDFAFRRSANP